MIFKQSKFSIKVEAFFQNNNSSSLVATGSVFTSNVTQTVYTHCTDKVGNTVNETLSIYVDNTPPAFTLFHPSIQGQCLPPSWSLSYSSSDPTTPINHYYSLNSSGTWSQLQQPFQPSQGFSGTLHLKIVDGVGNSNITSLNIPPIDSTGPSITISETATNYTSRSVTIVDRYQVAYTDMNSKTEQQDNGIRLTIIPSFLTLAAMHLSTKSMFKRVINLTKARLYLRIGHSKLQRSVWIQATKMSTMSATMLATLSDLSQRRQMEAPLP